ncbi:MAG: lamin tail domain-containing protein [Deltaproteobacteria bacterium]|nr:lamin tail domain-containing protein [Deltaproteobacteria bacterium]
MTGFKVTAQGASGLGLNIGISANGEEFEIYGNVVEGFGSGIGADGENMGKIYNNITRLNEFGIELSEVGPWVYVYNNLVLNNSKAGVILFSTYGPAVMHNTIIGNGFGDSLANGAAGVVSGPFNNDKILNNIIVSNNGGINRYESSSSDHHNLVWGNVENYAGDAQVGEGDLTVDPIFVDPVNKDYRLKSNSPAVDAAVGQAGMTSDFDGNLRPVGNAPDLGAYELQAISEGDDLLINEVLANPLDEYKGEFVELYNPTGAEIDAAGLVLDDGDSTDVLQAFSNGTTLVPAGGYAVVLDPDYVNLAERYDIPAEAILLSVPNATLGSGLSTSDPISLSRAGSIVSTYQHPFDPGNGISAERIDSFGDDQADNWAASPCGLSPGKANCISSGGSPAGTPSLVITEVMANPESQTIGEFVEVFNYGDDPVELSGLILSDGDSTDALISVAGKSTQLGAGQYGLIIDPDLIPQMEGAPYNLDASVPVVVSVANASLGNGLASTDPVSLLASDASTIISTFSHPMSTSAQSIEKVDPLEADLPGNWIPSPCADKHSAGRPNCASSGGNPIDIPQLIVNEVMSNPLDEDLGEFIEIFNQGNQPVDVAGLIFSDGDATDVIAAFPGQSNTVIPAGGYGLILDPEYLGSYSIPGAAVWLAPENTTLGNGLTTTDPITLLASDGVTVISSCSFPANPGNGISLERLGDSGDIASNWGASTCASGSSPGGPNCAGSDPDPDPVDADLVISEVMANPLDEYKGEFVEIVNTGSTAIDLAGYVLTDGDANDTIEGYLGGSTVLAAGAIGVVLDQSYVDLAEPYTIPAEAVLLTTDDATIGSGLSTDDPITLLAADGSTVLSTYSNPFNPGDGFSAERVDLAAADTPDNWVVSPCASGSSPGAVNCADQSPNAQVVDVNTASQAELEQVGGIGPATASAIVAYRTSNGTYESLQQLTVIDSITSAKLQEWMVSEEGEPEYVIGLAAAREVVHFDSITDLLTTLPDPASPGTWEGQPVRIRRAACLEQSDSDISQDLIFADWGEAGQFEPNGTGLPVYLDKDPAAGNYLRDQTDHANAMADWIKEDGDPFNTPLFYRWATPLWSFGEIAYAHVYTLEGVVEVDQGAWRLRIRAKVDSGIDRLVMIERWLAALDWQELQVVWTYNYKPVVIESVSGYSYSLPYRLALAHPCRQWWYDQHGQWIDVPRCPSFGECYPMTTDWNLFNQALAAWRQDPGPVGDYCFTYDYTDYCFTAEEEVSGVEILNNASFSQLSEHCYSTTLANTVLANRPFASIDEYDATYGVGTRSLWNLLVCYVRSGDWPEAAEGTVAKVLQDIPENEWSIVTVNQAEVTSLNGDLFEICDPGTSDCIAVFSYASLPAGLEVGAMVSVIGQVKYYTNGEYWELTVGQVDTWVSVLSLEDARAPLPGDLLINEFLADPGNALCDANCDGVRDAGDDEFVELVNISSAPLILDGVTLSDGLQVRHTFADGTTLDPGQPIVIFGGGPLACPGFAGLEVYEASSGRLSLNNTGDTITLADSQGGTINTYTYGAEADNFQALALSPDLNDQDPSAAGVSGFILHQSADDAGDRSRFSPGTRVDGSAF